MRYLTVSVTGEGTTLHPLVPTLTDPDVLREARMVEWSPSFDPRRVTVLLYLDGDLDRVEAVLAETELVLASDVTRFGDGRGYAYVHAEPHPTEWRLFELATAEWLVPVFPLEYNHDGTVTVRVVGPPERLAAAVRGAPPGVEASVERVGTYDLGRPPVPPALPPRQREALAVAHDAGYYEVPREASRDDVAARLGCAPSTASEHLRKAERRVVRTFLDRRR
jgi:predicted DNA binding protein